MTAGRSECESNCPPACLFLQARPSPILNLGFELSQLLPKPGLPLEYLRLTAHPLWAVETTQVSRSSQAFRCFQISHSPPASPAPRIFWRRCGSAVQSRERRLAPVRLSWSQMFVAAPIAPALLTKLVRPSVENLSQFSLTTAL